MKLKKENNCGQCKLKTKSKKDLRIHTLTCHSKSSRLSYSPSVKRLGRVKSMRKVKDKIVSYLEYTEEIDDEKLLHEDISIEEIELNETSEQEFETPPPPMVNKELTFRCLECDYRAGDKVKMEDHRKDYHKDIQNETAISYMCIECSKVFEEDEDYQKHMKIHESEQHKREKANHESSVSGKHEQTRCDQKTEVEQKTVSCTTCGNELDDETILKEHMKYHEQSSGFACTHCNFSASNSSDLNNHIVKSHLNGLNCPECEFNCAAQNKMKMHRETIHNLNCNLCGFTAVNTVVLYEHTKMHKSNYTCDTCDFRCPVKDDMTEHVNQTHGAKKKKKIFPCEECDDVFEQNGELNEHVSCHHQEPSISSEGNILHHFLKVLAKQ